MSMIDDRAHTDISKRSQFLIGKDGLGYSFDKLQEDHDQDQLVSLIFEQVPLALVDLISYLIHSNN